MLQRNPSRPVRFAGVTAGPVGRAMLTVLVCAAGLLTVSPAMAQGRASLETLDQRLQRVERVVDSSLLNLAQKVGEAQNEIRILRGEIESLRNDLQLLDKRNRDLYQDTDKRLSDLESGAVAGAALPGEGGQLSPRGTGPLIPSDGLSGRSAGEEELTLPDRRNPGDAPVIVVESESRVAAGGADAGGRPVPPAAPVTDNASRVATAAEQQAYREAYDLLASGSNEAAVAAFDRFLIEYPDGPYSDNAWYWQGEAMYARREFADAIRNFTVVADFFPASPKVSDARLKVGFALYEQQEYAAARTALTAVQNDYPDRSASVLARKRLQEMDNDGL